MIEFTQNLKKGTDGWYFKKFDEWEGPFKYKEKAMIALEEWESQFPIVNIIEKDNALQKSPNQAGAAILASQIPPCSNRG